MIAANAGGFVSNQNSDFSIASEIDRNKTYFELFIIDACSVADEILLLELYYMV